MLDVVPQVLEKPCGDAGQLHAQQQIRQPSEHTTGPHSGVQADQGLIGEHASATASFMSAEELHERILRTQPGWCRESTGWPFGGTVSISSSRVSSRCQALVRWCLARGWCSWRMPAKVDLACVEHREQEAAVPKSQRLPPHRPKRDPASGDAVAPERDVDAIAVALVLATRVEGFDRSPVGERVEPDRPEPLVARQVLDWVAGRGQQAVIDQVGPAGMAPEARCDQHASGVRPRFGQGDDDGFGVQAVVADVPENAVTPIRTRGSTSRRPTWNSSRFSPLMPSVAPGRQAGRCR